MNASYSFITMLRKYVNSSFLLILVTILALIMANSPFSDQYFSLWDTPISLQFGSFNLFSHHDECLNFGEVINDFLMAIFFFSVGLEIKREILVGELSSPRKALLPIIAACGGMIVPVLLFYILCGNNPDAAKGIAIPMATDIAFSLGVLSMFGKRVPLTLKIFLAALAVADDLGGIVVIAIFYSKGLEVNYLLYAAVLVIILLAGSYQNIRKKAFYIVLGVAVWYLFLNSGIHATISGVIVAFCVPARPKASVMKFVNRIKKHINDFPIEGSETKNGIVVLSEEQISTLKNVESASDHVISPLQDLEDNLRAPVNYVIIPLFAFASAGINFSGMGLESITSGVGLSVLLGLFIGKILGIFSFSWIATKLRIVSLPTGVTYKMVMGISMLGGIGFTVSMFIAGLSYHPESELLRDAKMGILCGSILSAIAGMAMLSMWLPNENVETLEDSELEKEIIEGERL